jgi:hypothetical protein
MPMRSVSSGHRGKGGAAGQRPPVGAERERRSEDDTGERLAGPERRAGQRDFEGGGIGGITDQPIADGERKTAGGATDGHAEAARRGPPTSTTSVRSPGANNVRVAGSGTLPWRLAHGPVGDVRLEMSAVTRIPGLVVAGRRRCCRLASVETSSYTVYDCSLTVARRRRAWRIALQRLLL